MRSLGLGTLPSTSWVTSLGNHLISLGLRLLWKWRDRAGICHQTRCLSWGYKNFTWKHFLNSYMPIKVAHRAAVHKVVDTGYLGKVRGEWWDVKIFFKKSMVLKVNNKNCMYCVIHLHKIYIHMYMHRKSARRCFQNTSNFRWLLPFSIYFSMFKF